MVIKISVMFVVAVKGFNSFLVIFDVAGATVTSVCFNRVKLNTKKAFLENTKTEKGRQQAAIQKKVTS